MARAKQDKPVLELTKTDIEFWDYSPWEVAALEELYKLPTDKEKKGEENVLPTKV